MSWPRGSAIFFADQGECEPFWKKGSSLKNIIQTYGHVGIYTMDGKMLNVGDSKGNVLESNIETFYDRSDSNGKKLTACLLKGYVEPKDFVSNFPGKK